jgi:hypothetical protein
MKKIKVLDEELLRDEEFQRSIKRIQELYESINSRQGRLDYLHGKSKKMIEYFKDICPDILLSKIDKTDYEVFIKDMCQESLDVEINSDFKRRVTSQTEQKKLISYIKRLCRENNIEYKPMRKEDT